ncbi:MAG: sulfurtransferase [Mycolicibacterium neoaurum]|uniref:sulfurtransferase n=1 Tax=Mycolicibacterium neoaurum TaxID=1795 RepID=UPI002FF7EFF5
MGDQARSGHVIAPNTLRAEHSDVVLLDVRQASDVDAPDVDAFLAGHIPGAIFVDLDVDLAGVSTGTNGRRPLPGPAEFQKKVRQWGIEIDTPVVVYGATGSAAPARAWWLLRWARVQSVRMLDGGLDGWVSNGGELQTGATEAQLPESDFNIRPGGMPVAELTAVSDFADRGLLLDARPAAKFSHPTAPGAGHIPGARNIPVAESLDAEGYLLPNAELRELFVGVGISESDEPAAYCGTGVAAALEVLVLTVLGIRAHLYVGSASEWTADPTRMLER